MHVIATRPLATLALALAASALPLAAQSVTLPPSGGNQKAAVIQHIGLVEVRIDYSSPDVTSPSGEDRTGKIWGQLVPWGMANLGFGTCGDQCPWRAGANENTTFSVSHDVEIEGRPLPAGTYGLHMIPGEEEWTLIFSKNHTSWGSFFYNAAEDALRVPVKAKEHPYTHWLTYEFVDRQGDHATAALAWENLQVSWTITVPDPNALWVANLREELRSSPGFSWQGWQRAAQFCLQNGVNLPEALTWAEKAVSLPFIGEESFTTLSTLAQAQAANGRQAESEATLAKAIRHPTASAVAVHMMARQLMAEGKTQQAVEMFKTNAELHPDVWPVNVGLARAHSALGELDEALKYARLAVDQAPDPGNRQNVEGLVRQLEQGQAID